MKMYEVKPGYWIPEGVSWEEHQSAVARNWGGDPIHSYQNDEARVWITKDGRRIPYDELTEEHLNNIVKMLIRNNKEKHFPNLMEMA